MRNLWTGGGKILLAVCLVWVTGSVAATAAPPKVIKAAPDNGATNVDPDLREIRVTFDQDMNRGGFAWTGGGETFPKLRGRPRWVDKRTCVLPAQLEPNHRYWLSVNSEQHKDFKSATGEPAVPYPIAFKTGESKKPRDKAETWQQDVKEAVTELRRAIDQHYSYRDLRKVNWNKQFARFEPRLLAAKSLREFAEVAAELLAAAKDMHIWLKLGDQTMPTFQRKVTPNCYLTTLSKVVPGWTQRSGCVWTGRFPDGVAYIQISTWQQDRIEAMERAFEALEDLGGAEAMIIDVRRNSGGSETLARHFAGCFVGKSSVYAKHAYRNPDRPSGFTQPQERKLYRKRGRPKYRGKVAVLMGPENMSSCEAFLLMMKQVPGAVLVGGRSYGSSGNPKPFDLGIGVTVFLPSWQAMLPDGTLFEGIGIKPDIEIKATPAELAGRDPILEAALKALRKQ